MQSGIRVEIKVESTTACPMAQTSATNGCSCRLISRSLPDESEEVLEVFLSDPDIEFDDDIETVFAYRSKSVYRVRHDRTVGCPCEHFDRLGCSLDSVKAEDGDMSIVSHMKDMDELQQVVDALRDHYPKAVIQRLVRLDEDRSNREFAMFDLAELTDRQREVLETAHEMGYFDYPKRSNSGDVAAALDINRSTLSQHLAAAQRKMLSALLDS